jgi:glyoxylase-like metal-dependent hydrolase (beta-lactamase superfamily II)/predicted DCC family thiol-disulfide oxidoreductase YuxK
VSESERYQVFYDEQCEICQAGVSWLRLLDRRQRVDCLPLDPELLQAAHPLLELERCLRELHVVSPDGRIWTGWDAVALLARLFPATWIVGALGGAPPFVWLGRLIYRFVAANRYALSKCRGGACRVARLGEVRRRAALGPFWTCYTIGMLLRLPLSIGAIAARLVRHPAVFLRNYRRRIGLLDGKLSLVMLNAFPCDLVTLLFGEQFVMILYDGVAIDPGSTRMRGALERQLRRLPRGLVRAVAATHHHEEHSGNLNWLAAKAGAGLFVGAETARLLQCPRELPRVRAWIIGQPPPLEPPFQILGGRLCTASGELEVIPAPGHCDDHIVLYDRKEKLLLAGDAFMGTYFSAPNPDVDSRKWIETLRRLLDLDIEILVEGHGHIHTLRPDIPDAGGLVVRRHPREALTEKLRFFEWLSEQIESGINEGLPLRAVEMTCFPWGRRHTWEQFLNDELSRMLSAGHWSRTELVRSFVRTANGREVLPLVYQAWFFGD